MALEDWLWRWTRPRANTEHDRRRRPRRRLGAQRRRAGHAALPRDRRLADLLRAPLGGRLRPDGDRQRPGPRSRPADRPRDGRPRRTSRADSEEAGGAGAAAAEAIETTSNRRKRRTRSRSNPNPSKSKRKVEPEPRTGTGPRRNQPVVSEEAHRSFACFGGTATVHVRGANTAPEREAADGARRLPARRPRPPLALPREQRADALNRDPRGEVPGLAPAAPARGGRPGRPARSAAGSSTRRCSADLERAGYRESLGGAGRSSLDGRSPATPQRAGAAAPGAALARRSSVDEAAGTIAGPPGVEIDSGGIAKGLLADLVGGHAARPAGPTRSTAAETSASAARAGQERRGPWSATRSAASPIHELSLREGAVATSGHRPALAGSVPTERPRTTSSTPRSGEPAFTGDSPGDRARAHRRCSPRSTPRRRCSPGPTGAATWLPHGGVLVLDDGEVEAVAARAAAAGGGAAP